MNKPLPLTGALSYPMQETKLLAQNTPEPLTDSLGQQQRLKQNTHSATMYLKRHTAKHSATMYLKRQTKRGQVTKVIWDAASTFHNLVTLVIQNHCGNLPEMTSRRKDFGSRFQKISVYHRRRQGGHPDGGTRSN